MKTLLVTALFLAASLGAAPPNILLILADDLGYGDVRCYNAESKVPTPNIDRLAREGMRFTDAHSPATVCTPTRYSLMTGQMAFRVPNGGTVFTGRRRAVADRAGAAHAAGDARDRGLRHGCGRQMACRPDVSRQGRSADPQR